MHIGTNVRRWGGIAILLMLVVGLAACQPLPVVPDDCPTLRQGSVDVRCVGELQGRLSRLGFMYGGLTAETGLGRFGPQTDTGVRKMQAYAKAHLGGEFAGMAVDGIFGSVSKRALNLLTPKRMAPYGLMPVCFEPGNQVCANLTDNVMWFMRDGVQVFRTPITGGGEIDGKPHPTPEGYFAGWYDPMGQAAVSSIYKVPVPWFVFITPSGPEGVHFSPDVGPNYRSHGCIRVPNEGFAAQIWQADKDGGGVNFMIYSLI